MRNQVANISYAKSLMNQNAIAKWNLDFSKGIARIVGLDGFAGNDVMFLDPRTVGRHPVRIKDNLSCMTQTWQQRKLSASDTDPISLDLFSALPQRQLKRRHIHR